MDQAVRHVLLRQGVLGIKVKIMKGHDPEGRTGPSKPLPDVVTSASSPSLALYPSAPLTRFPLLSTVAEPKEESPNSHVVAGLPVSEQARGATEINAPAPPMAPAPIVQEVAAPVEAAPVAGDAGW